MSQCAVHLISLLGERVREYNFKIVAPCHIISPDCHFVHTFTVDTDTCQPLRGNCCNLWLNLCQWGAPVYFQSNQHAPFHFSQTFFHGLSGLLDQTVVQSRPCILYFVNKLNFAQTKVTNTWLLSVTRSINCLQRNVFCAPNLEGNFNLKRTMKIFQLEIEHLTFATVVLVLFCRFLSFLLPIFLIFCK